MIQQRISELKELKTLREEGKFPGIPVFQKYKRFGEYMPALMRGVMYLVTAHSGVGKTQFWKEFFLLLPISIMLKNPDYKIKLKFIIFLLEESKQEFIDSLISGLLYRKEGLIVDPLELKSMKKTPLSDETIKAIERITPTLEFILSLCDIHDNQYNPTGLFKTVRNHAHINGEVVYEDRVFNHKDEHGVESTENVKVFKEYIPNDPDEYVFVICDHISLLSEEKNPVTQKMMDLRETMERWSFDYCRKQISKNFNYIVVNVQQQLQSSDEQIFHQGKTILEKLKPKASTLGDCKTTYRDHMVCLGLFNPGKHNVEKYHEYDLTQMKNTFRSVILLKNRVGRDGLEAPLFFKGSSFWFDELEKPEDMDYSKYP